MTDIVERLQADYSILKEDYDALRADNERLRANEAAAIFAFRETNDIALEEIKRLRTEVEHLRTTLGYLADNIDNPALVAVAEAALVERRALGA